MSETLIVRRENRLCRLILNRPEVLNALNPDMIAALDRAADELAADPEVRVVILEGQGQTFCSGADMSFFLQGLSASVWLDAMRSLGRAILKLRALPQPIITKLEGAAIGGGANLALCGDLVVAAENARFRENFVHLALTLDAGGSFFLPRMVGPVKARELAFLGDEISGADLARMGLVHKAVPQPQLEAEVLALASRLSNQNLASLSTIKRALEAGLDMTLAETLEWEAAQQSILLTAPEHRAAVEAFLYAKPGGST